MNIFKKFKATFNLKNPNKKEKGESEIRCLKYRIFSEFTTEHVFDTNPRHLQKNPFTPTESRKLQRVKSLSENNIALQTITTEKTENGKVKNSLWPSESEIQINTQPKEIDTQINQRTEEKKGQKKDDTQAVTQQKKEKGILKNKNEKVEIENRYPEEIQLYNEDSYAKTNFNEEITYEQYETIDDQLGEEDIYYLEPKVNENPDQYVVHKNPTVHFTDCDHEYEEPTHKSRKLDQKIIENPVYNLRTHPKLNPTIQAMDDEYAESIGLNTFGKSQKLKYPGDYSQEAASIFFDDPNDYDC